MDDQMTRGTDENKGGHKKPYVDMWKRMIKEFPVDDLVLNFPKMTILNLGENCIQNITGVEKLVNLEEFYLMCNLIEFLPPEIGQLSNLKKLVLRQNEIGFIPPEIGKLSKLKVLNLEANRLNSLPTQLRHCAKLKELHVQRNRIKKIPSEISSAKSLEKVYSEGNRKIIFPPLAVSEKGGTLRFLKDEYAKKKEKAPKDKEKRSSTASQIDQELAESNTGLVQQYPTLKVLMEDPKGLALFTTFLESEFATENLLFWRDADQFSRTDPSNVDEVRARATDILNIYIKDGAEKEINIPSHIRNEILEAFKKGNITITLYEHAQKNVFYTMEADPFKRFLRSK